MGKSNLYIGIGFLVFGLVQIWDGRWDEALLYLSLGVAFGVTWGSFREGISADVKRLLTIISWVLIAFSVFWFFWLVRSESF